jgi:hypothetical protein
MDPHSIDGLALLQHEKFQSAPGSRVGTPAYLAPEVIMTTKGQTYDGKVRRRGSSLLVAPFLASPCCQPSRNKRGSGAPRQEAGAAPGGGIPGGGHRREGFSELAACGFGEKCLPEAPLSVAGLGAV